MIQFDLLSSTLFPYWIADIYVEMVACARHIHCYLNNVMIYDNMLCHIYSPNTATQVIALGLWYKAPAQPSLS